MSNITQKWIMLFMPFTTNYKNKLTGTEMSKLTKIPQQTTSRILTKLTKIMIIVYNSKLHQRFFLNSY